ncbi:MAG: pyruvate formate lyase family protein [Candidatus Hermodarchaeota archaeon]
MSKSESIFKIAEPHDLSPRSKWLRDYYFKGAEREWNNQFSPFTTGTDWDIVWHETDYYVAPETHTYVGVKDEGVFHSTFRSMATEVTTLPKAMKDAFEVAKLSLSAKDFWDLSLPERRAVFFREVMLNYIPQEIVGPSLLGGSRFNTQLSKCFTKDEAKNYWKKNLKARKDFFKYHKSGFGNTGATAGHIIPNHETVIKKGFKFLYETATISYNKLSEKEKKGTKGQELRAMIISTLFIRELAQKYAEECRRQKKDAPTQERAEELEQMAKNLEHVPWEPAETFWQGVQALWITHMLILSEESYPGAGTSFGRTDQHLWALYKKDVIDEKNITKEFAKDILGSFWFHCNTAYDAMIKVGKQGITSAFGQLMTLSGCGPNGEDLTNELTYIILEVIDDWSPILEPKPNVRLHRNSPEKLLNIVIDIISRSQGAPFLINFDERSIAGMVLEGIPKEEAWDYACVGCLENTMQGNDRSGTVNCNPNLAKSIELTLWNGKNMPGNVVKPWSKEGEQFGPKTGNPEDFNTWEEFWQAWKEQVRFVIKHTADIYNLTEELRAEFVPTPYVSTIVKGCIERGLDVRNGGPEIRFITIEGVGYATTVDSLLAIKKVVYDDKKYSISQIKDALINDFKGNEYVVMQTILKNKTPKYGNDEEEPDDLARRVMKTWADETWNHKTSTDFQFRPGMLSWNYWAGSAAALTPATPDGREKGTFLSNAICPTNGADTKGPTAVTNSVGTVLGGKTEDGEYINYLPNGSSHTITFNPSILKSPEHQEKFKSYLKGYVENGGTCLQVNMLDAEMLKDAQKHPENYKNLLVRVTGYNAYFTAIGKELQDEIIARESHKM